MVANWSVNGCLAACFFGMMLCGALSMPLWKLAANRFGKYNTWVFYNTAQLLTNLLFLYPSRGDPRTVALICCLNGIPFGGQFLPESILSDVIDFDEVRR